MDIGVMIIIAVVAGILGGFIGAGVLKGQLTSVHKQRAAANYVVGNGLDLEEQKDRFLYKKLERREKPKPQTQTN